MACHVESFSTLLLEVGNELVDGLCLLQVVVVIRVEHLLESPLCPVIVMGVAGAHLAVPVKGEADLVELLAIAVDVLLSGDGRVLSRLDGILLGGQSVGVISHRIENIEAVEPLVASIDVTGNVSQRMTYMQSRTRRVRKHVEHVVFRTVRVLCDLVGLMVDPLFLPLFLNLSEIVVHVCIYLVLLFLWLTPYYK